MSTIAYTCTISFILPVCVIVWKYKKFENNFDIYRTQNNLARKIVFSCCTLLRKVVFWSENLSKTEEMCYGLQISNIWIIESWKQTMKSIFRKWKGGAYAKYKIKNFHLLILLLLLLDYESCLFFTFSRKRRIYTKSTTLNGNQLKGNTTNIRSYWFDNPIPLKFLLWRVSKFFNKHFLFMNS